MRDEECGRAAMDLAIAVTVVGLVVVAALNAPALGIQTALGGIAILLNLRPSRNRPR